MESPSHCTTRPTPIIALRPPRLLTAALSAAVALCVCHSTSRPLAAYEADEQVIQLGSLRLRAADDWERREPRSRIIAEEFSTPAAEGDDDGGRLTVMAAGGSIEANIDRWVGQFTQPDGGDTRKRMKVEERKIAGHDVYLVDLAGTYKDSPGPFAPGVDRKGYRMLAAIVVTREANFYLKLYGPQQTMAEQEAAFVQMIEGLSRR